MHRVQPRPNRIEGGQPPPRPDRVHDGGRRCPTDERALVKQAQAGDRDAFAELYAAHRDVVCAYIAKRVRSRELAEDLTQDVFVRALRALPRYRWQARPFVAWLVTIARNLVLDQAKAHRRHREITHTEWTSSLAARVIDVDADPGVRVPAQIAADLNSRRLHALLPLLTDEQRNVLKLRFWEQQSARDTATAMGKRPGAVKALQARAVAQLRRHFDEQEMPTS